MSINFLRVTNFVLYTKDEICHIYTKPKQSFYWAYRMVVGRGVAKGLTLGGGGGDEVRKNSNCRRKNSNWN